MTLTSEQQQAVKQGQVVPVIVDDTECVVVRKDVFDRVKNILSDNLDADTVYDLMEKVMAEDDANDPLLAGYQRYKR